MSMSMAQRTSWNKRRVPWRTKLVKAGLKTTFMVEKDFIVELCKQLNNANV